MSFSGFGDRNLFESNAALQYKVHALERIVEEFKTGKRYLKLQNDYHRVIAGYIKEIKRLRKELADAHAQSIEVRRIWTDECNHVWEENQSEISKKNEKIRKLEDTVWETRRELDEKVTRLTMEYEDKIREKDCIIDELKNRLAHAEALLGRDSTNTNTPTSQTPPGKNKHIPNSRRGQGKKKGGQFGHEKHTLEKPPAEEITDEIDHFLEAGMSCPSCGSENLVFTGEYEEKYEVDVEIVVKKTLHKYWLYQCNDCGEISRTGIDPNHRAECSYGAMVQASALSLMNTSNAAINKVQLFLSGITDGAIRPSEGYIAKLMLRAAKALETFMSDLFCVIIKKTLLYWDDTVLIADKKRICLRFYGDERVAYYVAHEKKDMNGIIEDGILDSLTEETTVMHDNNAINYNKRFYFKNVECNAHLQRDLQKIVDETGHEKPGEIKELISSAIKERNDRIASGKTAFEESYVTNFEKKLAGLLDEAENVAEANRSKYTGPFERAVIKRIRKYKDNFFAWIKDFSIPTTNNLSERSLRGAKTKLKVAGQFASTKTANNYARIKSYIETCRRNGINEVEALKRLCEYNPYTVEDIFSAG